MQEKYMKKSTKYLKFTDIFLVLNKSSLSYQKSHECTNKTIRAFVAKEFNFFNSEESLFFINRDQIIINHLVLVVTKFSLRSHSAQSVDPSFVIMFRRLWELMTFCAGVFKIVFPWASCSDEVYLGPVTATLFGPQDTRNADAAIPLKINFSYPYFCCLLITSLQKQYNHKPICADHP
jgi:hypothetical protein